METHVITAPDKHTYYTYVHIWTRNEITSKRFANAAQFNKLTLYRRDAKTKNELLPDRKMEWILDIPTFPALFGHNGFSEILGDESYIITIYCVDDTFYFCFRFSSMLSNYEIEIKNRSKKLLSVFI